MTASAVRVVANQAVMAAVAGAMVAVASAANLPQEKPAHPAKAVAEAKVELKAVKAKPVQHALSVANGVSARNAVSVPPAKAAVMAVHPGVVRTWLKASATTA